MFAKFLNLLSKAAQVHNAGNVGNAGMKSKGDIPVVTDFLKNNEAFKKGAMKVHQTKNGILDRLFDSLHTSAFPNDEAEARKQLEDNKKKK